MIWILVSIAAAAFQTLRFMLQKTLSMGALSTGGATYARFLFAVPFVGAITLIYLQLKGVPFPKLSVWFWIYALIGGLAQILGTWAMVVLFAKRNFAVGITFKKTEVLQAVLVGFVILGDKISPLGFGAILLGTFGVIFLSIQPGFGKFWQRLLSPTAGLGLLAGAIFSISAVGVRGATLQVPSDDVLVRALVTLFMISLAQTIAMALWLRLKEPGEIPRVVRSWRKSIWIGLAGMAGSICWFTAYTLQSAAYVLVVGQVEVIFSILASILFFHERLSRREMVGIVMITVSIILLIVVA